MACAAVLQIYDVDTQAERQICEKYAARIRAYGLCYLRDRAAAEDLVQQVLLTVLGALRDGRVEDLARLDHYVLGTCRNSVMELRRGAARQKRVAEQAARGVPEAYFCDRLNPEVRAALARTRQALGRAGHEVRTIAIDHAARTADVYLHIVLPEASWYHAPILAAHADRYSPGVRLRLEMGRYVLAEDYVRAMQLREVLRSAVNAALVGCDALLLPAQPMPAPELGVATVDIDGTKEPVRGAMLRLTQLFNITGHPAIALPAGTTREGWPIGVQLVGHFGASSRLVRLAARVEPYSTGGDGSVGGGTG